VTTQAPPVPTQQDISRNGLILAGSAYFVWGVLPIYLKLVGFADPWEIVGWRILFSAPAALLAVALTGGLIQLRPALRPKMLATLALSALFICGNWAIFTWAVSAGRVIESALAYFLAPLVNVVFGVTLFGERLTRAQGAAIGLAAIGVVVQALAMGAPPWVPLFLCATWCCYGLVRKQAAVSSASGLFVETMWLMPVAIGLLIWTSSRTGLAFAHGGGEALLLAVSGPLTAIPLMLFAFGARRLPFSTLGLLQYIGPTLTFFVGLAYGEPFTPLRGAGFALIWVGLILFSWDVLRRERRV
jgi:chloramphenicol-sensitive protein RarD